MRFFNSGAASGLQPLARGFVAIFEFVYRRCLHLTYCPVSERFMYFCELGAQLFYIDDFC